MPWESKKQSRWGHGKGGKEAGFSADKVKEFDDKTDWGSLPEEAACGRAGAECTAEGCGQFASCALLNAACGMPIASCTADACASHAACGQRAAACGNMAQSSCTADACASHAACGQRAAACGNMAQSSCTAAGCGQFASCSFMNAACGMPVASCTADACAQYATCAFMPVASVLHWGPRKLTLVEQLHWSVASCSCGGECDGNCDGECDEAEARPCTDGDDDSPYGPHGDDQKCTEGPGGDVPEGFQELDLDYDDDSGGGGDWGDEDVEKFLEEEPEEEAPLKKVMKEEEKQEKQQKKEQQAVEDEGSGTSFRIPRDPSLGPDEYHQFWGAREQPQYQWRNSTMSDAVRILEDRIQNPDPKKPGDAEAARSILMNGPPSESGRGGGYKPRAPKREEGLPYAEDFEGPDRSREPIV